MTDDDAPSAEDAELDGDGGETEPTLLDVMIYGPIDAAFSLLRDPRGAALRGHARVDQALRQARTLGELTVRFGQRELRRRTEGSSEAAPATTDTPGPTARRAAGPAPDDVIADYDALSASQIVPMLQGLDPAERARVADYERRARARQTILRKIELLDGTGD
ncbi:MAG TPA: hypothetical protein VGZ33_01450 [Acidimicrobiales bacterium]|nr:hypothetical protein [Acidimicrobiales bacterium]